MHCAVRNGVWDRLWTLERRHHLCGGWGWAILNAAGLDLPFAAMPKSCTPSASPRVSPTPPSAPDHASQQQRARQPSSAFSSKLEKLERRFGSSGSLASDATAAAATEQPPAKRQRSAGPASVRVAACTACCSGNAQADLGWCSAAEVAIPPTDWPEVMQAVASARSGVSTDADGLHVLPGGIRVRVVSRADQLPAALSALRASMEDTMVAIDMEWQPDGFGRGKYSSSPSNATNGNPTSSSGSSPGNRVALLQLASSTFVVLVRLSRMAFALPPPLAAFLRDPGLTFVAYGWDGADEQKAQLSFGAGREQLFARFLDLQQVSVGLGYHGYGLGSLTRQVLGFEPPKSRKISLSNWAAWSLSGQQIQYAALDALITGAVLRGLRLWHASPSSCTSCGHTLGMALPPPQLHCLDCGSDKAFSSFATALSHARSKGHSASWQQCTECGRTCSLPAAAATAAD